MALRIATYNVESLDFTGPHAASFPERIAVLRPMLLDLAADVLCLQEVNAQKSGDHRDFAALDQLITNTPYAAFHRVHSLRPSATSPADVHNLVILSRYEVLSHRSLWHDYVPPTVWHLLGAAPDACGVKLAWDRPILHATIKLPSGAILHVIDLHLRAPRASFLPGAKLAGQWRSTRLWAEAYLMAAQKRQGQALEARLLVEDLFDADPHALIIVCGDLNAEAYEMPTRILQALPEDVETNAFSDRALSPLEQRIVPSRRHSVLHAGRPVLLDHILVSPALAARCVHVEIRNEGLLDEATALAPVAGSLHAPLLAQFDLD